MIGFMIAVGKAVKPTMPKGGKLALSEMVVQDRFACQSCCSQGTLEPESCAGVAIREVVD